MGLRIEDFTVPDDLIGGASRLDAPMGGGLYPSGRSPLDAPGLTVAQRAEERARRRSKEDQIRKQLEAEQAETFLGKLGRTFGGPGYAVMNLMRGRPGAAVKNLADTALGVVTLDPITGLGSRFASREEQPTASEVLEDWGVDAPRGRGARFAVDVAGGLLTDPLSYLTLGGSSIARSAAMAQKVKKLSSMPGWAGDLGTALSTTKAGRMRWQDALDEASRVRPTFVGGPSGKVRVAKGADIDEEAARIVMKGVGQSADPEGYIATLKELEGRGDILRAGLRFDPWLIRAPLRLGGLIPEGAMEPRSISRLGGALDDTLEGRGFWAGPAGRVLRRYTAPGWIYGAASPKVQEVMRMPFDATIRRLFDPTHGKFKNISRGDKGLLYLLQDAARITKEKQFRGSQDFAHHLARAFEGLDTKTTEELRGALSVDLGLEPMNKIIASAVSRIDGVSVPKISKGEEWAPGLEFSAAKAMEVGDGDLERGYRAMYDNVRGEVNRLLDNKFQMIAKGVVDKRKGDMRWTDDQANAFADRLHHVQAFIHQHHQKMLGEAQDQGSLLMTSRSVKVGDEGEEISRNLGRIGLNFYVPNQMSDVWSELLMASAGRGKVRPGATGVSAETAYNKFRKTGDAKEFRRSIEELARKAGISVSDIDVDPMKMDLFDLVLRRNSAHVRAMTNKEFIDEAARLVGRSPRSKSIQAMGESLDSIRKAEFELEELYGKLGQLGEEVTEAGEAIPTVSGEAATNPYVRMVPIEDMIRFSHENRHIYPKSSMALDVPTTTQMKRLISEFSAGEPIQTPIYIGYSSKGTALIEDGNTRLAALEASGFRYVPVRVMRVDLHGWGAKTPTKVSLDRYRSAENLLPSDLGLPEISAPPRAATFAKEATDELLEEIAKKESHLRKVGGWTEERMKSVRSIGDVEWPVEGAEAFVRSALSGIGKRGLVGKQWDGVNSWLKQSMTVGIGGVPFLSFSTRNLVGGMVQALMDPSLTASDAIRPMFALMHDMPIARYFSGPGSQAAQVGLFRKALENVELRSPHIESFEVAYKRLLDAGDESAKALSELEKSGVRIAGKDPVQVFREIAEEGVVGRDYAAIELFKRQVENPETLKQVRRFLVGTSDEPPKNLPRQIILAMKTNALPRRIASAVEDTMRLNSYLSMRRKGISPQRASERVNRIHVDYKFMSEFDRNMRSIFPFIAFRKGTLPVVTEQAITRPGTITPFAKALHSMRGGEDDQSMVPPWLHGKTALPVGEDKNGNVMFLTSFGLIHEDVDTLLTGFGDLAAFATGKSGLVGDNRVKGVTPGEWANTAVLASMHPWVKGFLQYVTGKDFYFGTEIGDYTRAPQWMVANEKLRSKLIDSGFLKETVTKKGKKYYNIPRWYHPAMGLTPLDRLSREIDYVLDDRHDWVVKVLRSGTGVKISTPNEEKELKRRLSDWLKDQVRAGDISAMEVFFSKGELSPEVSEMLQAYNEIVKGKKPKKKPNKPGPGVGPPPGVFPSRSFLRTASPQRHSLLPGSAPGLGGLVAPPQPPTSFSER